MAFKLFVNMKGGIEMKITEIIQKTDIGEPYDYLLDVLDISDILKLEKEYSGRQIQFRRNCTNVKEDYPELVVIVGYDKAQSVIKILGDMRIYFPTIKRSALEKIKKLIISEFNGYNHISLAKKYGYSERHIRNIVGCGNESPIVLKNQLTILDTN